MENAKNIKPCDLEEYKEWLRKNHNIDISERYKTYYDSVTNKLLNDFTTSQIWQIIGEKIGIFNQEYYLLNKYFLFITEKLPDFKIKPYTSFLLKTYRKNIIENPDYPNKPKCNWVFPETWFSQINDIIRGLFVVKYIDGVNFLCEKFSVICNELNIKYKIDYEAKEEGYYAAHFYIIKDFEIPKENWDTISTTFYIEIQITTQLQEVLRTLLHKYYENNRKLIQLPEKKWQWDYKSDEFSTNYLGHILHYVEGMIMEIRDKQKDK